MKKSILWRTVRKTSNYAFSCSQEPVLGPNSDPGNKFHTFFLFKETVKKRAWNLSMLILFSHLCLGLPICPFTSGFQQKRGTHIFIFTLICTFSLPHHIFLDVGSCKRSVDFSGSCEHSILCSVFLNRKSNSQAP